MGLLDPIKEPVLFFIAGCLFWHFRVKIKERTYDKIYDWWNKDGKGKKRKTSNNIPRR